MSFENRRFPTDPFHSDIRAFEILEEQGLSEAGIQLIKNQVAELSDGYRHPERKLADVLDGGAIIADENMLLLLHGMGGIERGAGAGDCSESSRALVRRWGESSQHRHLGKIGLHPFYLEVAAPRLFTSIWDTGNRVRAGHTVVALGSPKEYIEKSSDASFIIIDPTLGTVTPMDSSSYRQTGASIVPEHDKSPRIIPVAIFNEESDNLPAGAAPFIILGIDESASFAYGLYFKRTPDGPVPKIVVSDEKGEPVAKFETDTRVITAHKENASKVPLAEPTLTRLAGLLMERELELHGDFNQEKPDALIAGGRSFQIMSQIHYPRVNSKSDIWLRAMEYALQKTEATGQAFSLKF